MDERVYVLEIGERPVLCFPAAGFQDAQSLLKEDWLHTDLKALRTDGKPLWDGDAKLRVRQADASEAGRFDRESKSLPQNGDLPIVYLVDLYWTILVPCGTMNWLPEGSMTLVENDRSVSGDL
jgi:hypothetical protein